jgi:hypothetical protein
LICSATRPAAEAMACAPAGALLCVLDEEEAERDFLPAVRRRVCPKAVDAGRTSRQARTIIEMRFNLGVLLQIRPGSERVAFVLGGNLAGACFSSYDASGRVSSLLRLGERARPGSFGLLLAATMQIARAVQIPV